MGFVTFAFYTQVYYGEPILWEDFPRYAARAEDLIFGLIRSTEEKAAELSEDLQVAIKKAICAQIEYFQEYGLGVSVSGKEAGGGFTVGKVSVSNGSSAAASGARSMIAPAVYVYLEQTGLLNPSVATAEMPPLSWGWWL